MNSGSGVGENVTNLLILKYAFILVLEPTESACFRQETTFIGPPVTTPPFLYSIDAGIVILNGDTAGEVAQNKVGARRTKQCLLQQSWSLMEVNKSCASPM